MRNLNKILSKYFVLLICFNLNASVLKVGPGKDYTSISEAILMARRGDTVLVYGGYYKEGTIEIRTPIALIGLNNPILDGEHEHEVIQVYVDSVTIKGFTLKDIGISYIEDRSAIRIISSDYCVIEANNLRNSFFGIYLEHCNNCTIRDNDIRGQAEHEMNSGNAIHLWYCSDILIVSNHAEGHRDGIYMEFVDNSTISKNRVINNLRYGLHFMFSDNDKYLDNYFASNGAGVAVMFSKYIWMENNEFIDNWGSSSYGLLLKEITDSEIRFNRFERNTTGIYAEGVNRTRLENNDFKMNGWALNILGSCADNMITGNNFLNNTFDISTNSSRNHNSYNRNYWSDNTNGYDLNKDGISDVPYRPVKLFSYMVANMQSVTILMRSLLVDLINHAEKVAPVITPYNLLDNEPMMKRIENDRDQGVK